MKLFCDLHMHSCLSPCGDMLMTPNNMVGMAFIKQLDAIAVCDHNAAGNLPAVKAVADMMGVVLLPGLELTTREEAHMLAYFPEVERAVAFGEVIRSHLPPIPNRPEFFGRQVLMNEEDEETGEEDTLLISALDLSFEECERLIHAHGGLCVPAHINRGSNGVLNALGFLPDGAKYDALEVSDAVAMPPIDLSGYRLLKSSDAHYLENMLEPSFFIEAREKSTQALFDAIVGCVPTDS